MNRDINSAADLRDFLNTLSEDELKENIVVFVETKKHLISGFINSAEQLENGNWCLNFRKVLKEDRPCRKEP